ncbi:MAG TPA: hypothetical protein VNM14_18370 [Planctomycetota bacterium]|jgi:hypothetical protein|nr:hypothetical protein [Planctomycetota bacterium]
MKALLAAFVVLASAGCARDPGKCCDAFSQTEDAGVYCIAGDFVQWNPDGVPLHHNGTDEWYVTLELPPGDYQYRLRADGAWIDNPEATRRVDNPFGSQNCVLTVE